MAIAGKSSHISVDGNDISQYVESLTFSQNVETAQTQGFGDSNVELITALKSASLSLDITWASTQDGYSAGGFDDSVVAVIWGPEGNTTGNVKYTLNMFQTGYEISSDVTGKVSASMTLESSGAVTRGTFA